MDRETVYLYILVRPLEFGQPRLGNWHWILQAAIGFRHIIYTSIVEIIYANNDQSPYNSKKAPIGLYFVRPSSLLQRYF